MTNLDNLTQEVKAELKEMIKDTLEYFDGNICDLHHEVFNTDYFIIGTYRAKEWLKANYGVFEAIDTIQEYEDSQFGERYTDLSDPEKVCNMLVYILGEEILQDIKAVSDNWNEDMTDEIKQEILEELEG